MTPFSPELFLSTLALIGAVIVVAALLSGWVDRSGVPQVAVFLAIGAAIGPAGLNLLDAQVASPMLRVVATLSLVLVLFTDAVSLDLKEVREHKLLASLVLGPGTLLSAALIAVAAWYLLDLTPPLAAILGAALASTDPVLLRTLLRLPGLDRSVRQALRLESGMNDAVLLPAVLVAITVAGGGHKMSAGEWGTMALNMVVLSPGAGVIIALIAVAALEFIRKRTGVRRDYESIYSLGVAFAAFAAAESVHGSGFLAAFAAGLTISALDVELCDCFLEYGETTAEMALLLTFVLFGTSIIWTGLGIAGPVTLLFTLVVFLLRPLAFVPALLPAPITWRNRGLIGWFGPRGLSSLLLVLLAVFANLPGSESLLTICCLVVLCSVVLHGLTPMLLVRTPVSALVEPVAVASPAHAPVSDAQTQEAGNLALLPNSEYLTVQQFQDLREAGAPVFIVDSRTDRTYEDTDRIIPQSFRLHPDRAGLEAERQQISYKTILAVLCA